MQAKKSPYDIIKSQHITEKSTMLESLRNAKSNLSVKRCLYPKYVFIVDRKANKPEIAKAVEEIYSSFNIKVVAVNTIILKPKKRRVRGHLGKTSYKKKAIVTLEPGDNIGIL